MCVFTRLTVDTSANGTDVERTAAVGQPIRIVKSSGLLNASVQVIEIPIVLSAFNLRETEPSAPYAQTLLLEYEQYDGRGERIKYFQDLTVKLMVSAEAWAARSSYEAWLPPSPPAPGGGQSCLCSNSCERDQIGRASCRERV